MNNIEIDDNCNASINSHLMIEIMPLYHNCKGISMSSRQLYIHMIKEEPFRCCMKRIPYTINELGVV